MEDDIKRVHVFASGRVQGVFFRANTRKEARKRNLTGWVKNLADGRVEVVAEGKEDKVKDFLAWLEKGPPMARVEGLEIKFEEAKEDFNKFEIVR